MDSNANNESIDYQRVSDYVASIIHDRTAREAALSEISACQKYPQYLHGIFAELDSDFRQKVESEVSVWFRSVAFYQPFSCARCNAIVVWCLYRAAISMTSTAGVAMENCVSRDG